MKYFVTENNTDETIFHVLYKGKLNNHNKRSCQDDSILIHDDILWQHKGFYNALYEAVPGFDVYDDIEVPADCWNEVRKHIPQEDKESIELYEEADEWVQEALKEYGYFVFGGI